MVFFTKNFLLNKDFTKYIAQIEKGESKIQRHFTLIKALEFKMKSYQFPQYQMKLPLSNKVTKYYNDSEDRFMLVQLYKYGLDNPNFYSILQNEFRKSSEFRFDWFIKSRTQFVIFFV